MPIRPFPPRDRLTIAFAHAAYRLGDRFAARDTGIRSFEVRSLDELQSRVGEADVLVVSGLWRNELLERAPRLAFVQSISAGTDQYSRDAFVAAGVRLASAQGANERAVAEHAIALILAVARKIAEACDNQRRHAWRGMIGEIARREREIGGKTLVVVGLGRIGTRLAALARAFGMHVIGVKRDLARGSDAVDELVPQTALLDALPRADFVALTCPLTPSTERLIEARALAAMKPTAVLVNVARGKVVDEAALIDALTRRQIGGAALDCVEREPLPPESPLWDMDNVLITPHSAGETQDYEDNVLDCLLENLERLGRGEARLRNEIV